MGASYLCYKLKVLGVDAPGGMQEYWAVPVDRLLKVPEAIGDDQAPLIEPLAVANWYPSGNAPCVERETAVWITFTEPLDATSIAGAVSLMVGARELAVALEIDAEAATIALTPAALLDFGTVHTVELAPEIRAAGGEELGAIVTSRFRTIPQEGCAGAVECLVDNDCPSGSLCSVTSRCVSGCADDRDCALGLSCGGGTCQ